MGPSMYCVVLALSGAVATASAQADKRDQPKPPGGSMEDGSQGPERSTFGEGHGPRLGERPDGSYLDDRRLPGDGTAQQRRGR